MITYIVASAWNMFALILLCAHFFTCPNLSLVPPSTSQFFIFAFKSYTAIIITSDLQIQGVLRLRLKVMDFKSEEALWGIFWPWKTPWMDPLDAKSKTLYPSRPWIYESKVKVMVVLLNILFWEFYLDFRNRGWQNCWGDKIQNPHLC